MFAAISDIIALLALILSGFAAWKTFQFNERQKSLIESQEKLNALLLQRSQSEALTEKRADLGANFVKIGSSSYRLRIFNKGRATARQVRIEFPDGNDFAIQSEIDKKFPLEALEQHQAVELIAAIHMGSKPKQTIRLLWNDDTADNNEKIVYPTL